jgi:hypothetical protein
MWPVMSATAPPPSACLNCGQPFGQPRPRYRPACAQGSNVKPPTLLEFAPPFGGALLSTEGAPWRTLKLLGRCCPGSPHGVNLKRQIGCQKNLT